MTNFQHFGLYFTPDHVQKALKNRDQEPFLAAWNVLLDSDSHPGAPAAIQLNGLLYRFNDDSEAGQEAVDALQSGIGLYEDVAPLELEASAMNVILAQCFELVRDHAAWTHDSQASWLQQYAAQVQGFNQAANEALPLVERVWFGLVNLTAGIVLEDETLLEAGAAIYRQTIDNEIRPEGYLPLAVEGNDGGSLYRQMFSVSALVLMAEAASHIGLDLWRYTSRGISVVTAASYLIYYYYYPDQWRWDTISQEEAAELFRSNGALLEMVNLHARPKDLKLLLDDLRPLYSLNAGGLTTLSHALPNRRGLFG
jgi:hypothetical protein